MRQGRARFAADCWLPATGYSRGVTLLDVVVGSALMVVVFVGIAGAFRLSIEAVTNNKARAGAIALATERLEYIRSLPYDSVGTVGGIPAGALDQTSTTTLNDTLYTRRTFISYEDDPADGLAAADTNHIVTDFKAVKVSLSWRSRQSTRTLTMVTRVSPLTIEQAVPGGTISVQVTNDADQPVSNATVRIVNGSTTPAIDLTTYTDIAGLASVLGAPPAGGYAVTVTKTGYSTAQTYGTSASNTSPIPAHLGVALNQTTAMNFEIDQLSTYVVQTFEAIKETTWTDPFNDISNIASSTAIDVSAGTVHLVDTGNGYVATGTVYSIAPSIPYLYRWKEASWSATKPSNTAIVYRIYDGSLNPLSDVEVPGNGAGFTAGPINLTSVSTSTHAQLKLGATLTTSDASSTPSITSWSLKYDEGPIPLPNIQFTMRGTKTIGSGPSGPVYKYDATLSSGATSTILLNNIEYDTYTLSVPASTNYDVSSSCAPQPITITPATQVTTQLFLSPHTTNSLLVDVKSAAGTVIPNATVRLRRASSSYDTTHTSDTCGQAFFENLATGSVGGGNPYTLDVSATGYQAYTSAEVNVSGTGRLSVILN